MSIALKYYLTLASGLISTTYGYGERMCGDVGAAVACIAGAVTASGEEFRPQEVASAAVAAPARLRIEATEVHLKIYPGPYACRPVRVNDKMNPRWIGKRGFDLSPAAVELLTGQPATERWSGVVQVCGVELADD